MRKAFFYINFTISQTLIKSSYNKGTQPFVLRLCVFVFRVELSIPVQSKNTQNSNSKRSSSFDRVDAAKPIGNRWESAGVEAVHSEGVVISKDVSEKRRA